ncbi:5-formyltetrahydrofolate cyclo-ligase [Phenylobacterium terrae]|uniref:5-formyltetrahydrofolate cyclo-ligase n=1 Tax=Phenylobacterium terrae TaxID=2665495 RepID=A0ABW4N128_9CAUL
MPGPSDKTELRRRMRAQRLRLARAWPDAAELAAGQLPAELLSRFAVVSGYHAMGTELDPRAVLRRFAEAGARLALPVAEDRDAPLVFRAWAPGDPQVPDAFGIPSPPHSAEHLAPDLVIAPLLAFDRHGHRLGQGAGHYDRTLANLRAAKPVFVLGLAYAGQEVEELPAEPHDERLDAILTETGYIEVR